MMSSHRGYEIPLALRGVMLRTPDGRARCDVAQGCPKNHIAREIIPGPRREAAHAAEAVNAALATTVSHYYGKKWGVPMVEMHGDQPPSTWRAERLVQANERLPADNRRA